jgi:hypothetical protein
MALSAMLPSTETISVGDTVVYDILLTCEIIASDEINGTIPGLIIHVLTWIDFSND